MKVSITEARRRLPELVRRVRQDAGTTIQITVRDEVVAEIRPALPEPQPGAAARKLVELMERLPKHRGAKRHTSRRVKEYLYAGEDGQD
jgi:antitoxin (DNA-binding transcriptional repressor) of toxin-antitoxin stability system